VDNVDCAGDEALSAFVKQFADVKLNDKSSGSSKTGEYLSYLEQTTLKSRYWVWPDIETPHLKFIIGPYLLSGHTNYWLNYKGQKWPDNQFNTKQELISIMITAR